MTAHSFRQVHVFFENAAGKENDTKIKLLPDVNRLNDLLVVTQDPGNKKLGLVRKIENGPGFAI